MIKLQKSNKPQVLVNNAENWTAELMAALGNGDEPKAYQKQRYNHAEIKDSLRAETHGKCAYCESKFGHVTFGDIEHITPRKESPELSFEWQNLTIACDVCNTRKGAVEYGILVDPYAEDPAQFLVFAGALAIALPGEEKGEATVAHLDLNRGELYERREERLGYVRQCLSNIVKLQNPATRQLLLEDFLEKELAASAQYSAATLSFYNQVKHKLPPLAE